MKRRFLARRVLLPAVAISFAALFSAPAHADDAPPAANAAEPAREGVAWNKPFWMPLAPGDIAPDFALPGVDDKLVSSRSWLSQSSLLVISVGAPAKPDMSGDEPLSAPGAPQTPAQVLEARRVAEAVKGAAPRLQKRGVAVVVIAHGPYFEAMKSAMGPDFKAAVVPQTIEPTSPNLFLLRDDATSEQASNGRVPWSTLAGLSESGVSLTGIDLAGFVRVNESVGDLLTLEPLLSLMGDVSPKVEIGKPAPDFAVRDDKGRARRLSDLRGQKNLLLTFFPKCFTGGCANHLTSLQNERLAFQSMHTEVWAVSFDPATGERGQLAFGRQLNLTMPLIPDVGKNLSMLYESALSPEQPAPGRMSVLIDRDGIVRFIDRAVQVRTHGPDMLLKMRELGLK
jgi:peroxiredoxin